MEAAQIKEMVRTRYGGIAEAEACQADNRSAEVECDERD